MISSVFCVPVAPKFCFRVLCRSNTSVFFRPLSEMQLSTFLSIIRRSIPNLDFSSSASSPSSTQPRAVFVSVPSAPTLPNNGHGENSNGSHRLVDGRKLSSAKVDAIGELGVHWDAHDGMVRNGHGNLQPRHHNGVKKDTNGKEKMFQIFSAYDSSMPRSLLSNVRSDVDSVGRRKTVYIDLSALAVDQLNIVP